MVTFSFTVMPVQRSYQRPEVLWRRKEEERQTGGEREDRAGANESRFLAPCQAVLPCVGEGPSPRRDPFHVGRDLDGRRACRRFGCPCRARGCRLDSALC